MSYFLAPEAPGHAIEPIADGDRSDAEWLTAMRRSKVAKSVIGEIRENK
jgi:hypothetical protein